MTSFIEKHDILSSSQYGFITGRGTKKALDDLSDGLNNVVDCNEFACSVFLDVSKAFDSVNHDVVLGKLHQCGFRGPFLSLLEDYVRDCQQNVVLGKITSSPQILLLKGILPPFFPHSRFGKIKLFTRSLTAANSSVCYPNVMSLSATSN